MIKDKKELMQIIVCITIATIGFSLNGPFGRMVDLPSGVIAWGRGLFASLSLLLFLLFKKEKIFVFEKKIDILYLILSGVFIGGNWFFFYLSIKTSSVAVAVVSLYAYPFITSILEPFILKEHHQLVDLLGAAIVVIGVFLIVPQFKLSNKITQGAIWGMMSGLSFSLRNIISRKFVRRYSSGVISFYNFLVVFLLFTPFLFFNNKPFTITNIGILFVFGGIITTFAVVLFTYSLKIITSSLASIFLATQPTVTVILNYFINGGYTHTKDNHWRNNHLFNSAWRINYP